jgi:hypothetical protein
VHADEGHGRKIPQLCQVGLKILPGLFFRLQPLNGQLTHHFQSTVQLPIQLLL